MANRNFNIFVISDLHFRHDKIIQIMNRSFANTEAMHRHIIRQWNGTVRPQDMVIIVGDFIWTAGASEEMVSLCKQLNGRKILVKGNHDTKSDSFYMDRCVDFVCNRFEWTIQGNRVIFIHHPDHIVVNTPNHDYNYIVHGHTHTRTPFLVKWNDIIYINVGAEHLKYLPMSLDTLMSRAGKFKNEHVT